MPDIQQDIESFLARRKQAAEKVIAQGGEKADALLKRYGAPSMLDAAGAGAEQGILHGFADDIERAGNDDHVASDQIRAKAAHPLVYMLSNLIGTMGVSGGLRAFNATTGKLLSATSRARTVAGAAGDAAGAQKAAAKASKLEQTVASWGLKPKTRGTVLDAAHGAAWGYGGSDVDRNEDAVSAERLARAGVGAAASGIFAPGAASLTVAAGNIPLAVGKRRMFSEKMLEPPGVTRENPAGRPRDAIDIARSLDESAARGASGRGIIARDTANPVDSTGRNTQALADEALAPIAEEQVTQAAAREREAAAQGMEKAYPDTRQPPAATPEESPGASMFDGLALTHGQRTVLEMRARGAGDEDIARTLDLGPASRGVAKYLNILQQAGEKRVNAEVDKLMAARLDQVKFSKRLNDLKDRGLDQLARFIYPSVFGEDAPASGDIWGQMMKARDRWANAAIRDDMSRMRAGRHYDEEAGQNRFAARTTREDEAQASDAQRFKDEVLGRKPAVTTPATTQPTQPAALPGQAERDRYITAMLEPVARGDGAALESWISSLEAAHRKDPQILPAMRGAVAKQLAINERIDPKLNNTPAMRSFLFALKMAGNKTAGIPNVLDAARGEAAAANTSGRFKQALDRTANDGPRMRPRHAERMRQEMQDYEPGPYTGPADARRGKPLIARGDDQPLWLNPLDFFRDGKVNDDQVTMAGFLSGPIAAGLEHGAIGPASSFLFAEPDDDKKHEGFLSDLTGPAPQPVAKAPAAQAGPAPASRTSEPHAEAAPAARVSGSPVKDMQGLLLAAGLDVGPEGDDGKLGPNTRSAMEAFARVTKMPGAVTPERVLKRMQAYPREKLAEAIKAELARKAGAPQ